MNERILIIEDEDSLAKGLRLNLESEGYQIDWAADGQEGFAKALEKTPDLIILDLMLPKMKGLEVCQNLRQKNITTPIIMLTAKGEEIDKVIGLEVGADDYMTKPFGIRELLARIKAHLRRKKREGQLTANIYRVGGMEIDFSHYKITRQGKEWSLTSLEVEILKYMIDHRGEVVTRDDLLDKVWGYDKFPTTRTIDNHIMKLRKKIEGKPNKPTHILSVYGGGYRFID